MAFIFLAILIFTTNNTINSFLQSPQNTQHRLFSDWSKKECKNLQKNNPGFNCELIVFEITSSLEKFISDENITMMSREEKMRFSTSMTRRLFNQIKCEIEKAWDEKFCKVMGENALAEFYEIASHCLDGTHNNLLLFKIESEGIGCGFNSNVKSIVNSKIEQDFQSYVVKKRKEEEKRNEDHRRLLAHKHSKEKNNHMKIQDYHRGGIVQDYEQGLQKMAFELDMVQQAEHQKIIAGIIAANSQNAKKFFEQHESGQTDIAQQEDAEVGKLQIAMDNDWRSAARATMVRTAKELQCKEEIFAKNNEELNRQLQESDRRISVEAEKSIELAKRLEELQATRTRSVGASECASDCVTVCASDTIADGDDSEFNLALFQFLPRPLNPHTKPYDPGLLSKAQIAVALNLPFTPPPIIGPNAPVAASSQSKIESKPKKPLSNFAKAFLEPISKQ